MTDEETIFGLGIDAPDLWEVIAALQVMQAVGGRVISAHLPDPFPLLAHFAGLRLTGQAPEYTFKFDNARRTLAKCPHDASFQLWLGRESGLKLSLDAIKPLLLPRFFPSLDSTDDIILCPFSAIPFMQPIPVAVWKSIAMFLRTFGVPVRLMGDPGERVEGLNFTEGNILSDLPLEEKLGILATAKMVVGMPNAWTWLASTFHRPICVYYPDTEPMLRWFGFYNSPLHGRVSYSPTMVQIPVMLMGLRTMSGRLNDDGF